MDAPLDETNEEVSDASNSNEIAELVADFVLKVVKKIERSIGV